MQTDGLFLFLNIMQILQELLKIHPVDEDIQQSHHECVDLQDW
jgi:hypothetical protein